MVDMSCQNTFAIQYCDVLEQFFTEVVSARREFLRHKTRADWSVQHLEPLTERIKTMFPVERVMEGLHSVAFITEHCVIKTNLAGEPELDGQATWLRWCMKNQDNPLAPRVSFLMCDKHSDRYLVVMERLEEHAGFDDINDQVRAEIDSGGLGRLFDPQVNIREVKARLKELEVESRHAIYELQQDINSLTEEDNELKEILERGIVENNLTIHYLRDVLTMCKAHSKHKRHFTSVINKLCAEIKKGSYILDVHSLNWMKRKNGQHVLLDPLN